MVLWESALSSSKNVSRFEWWGRTVKAIKWNFPVKILRCSEYVCSTSIAVQKCGGVCLMDLPNLSFYIFLHLDSWQKILSLLDILCLKSAFSQSLAPKKSIMDMLMCSFLSSDAWGVSNSNWGTWWKWKGCCCFFALRFLSQIFKSGFPMRTLVTQLPMV